LHKIISSPCTQLSNLNSYLSFIYPLFVLSKGNTHFLAKVFNLPAELIILLSGAPTGEEKGQANR
ncbi:hypothetical protein NRH64_003289, partial [Proteus mirabilis]